MLDKVFTYHLSTSSLPPPTGRAISVTRSLTELNLGYNGIGDLGAEAIASALMSNQRYVRTYVRANLFLTLIEHVLVYLVYSDGLGPEEVELNTSTRFPTPLSSLLTMSLHYFHLSSLLFL